MDKFENARKKYKPEVIKYLLVAETPPKADSDRFIYFEEVGKQDSLFIETIKVLYPEIIEKYDVKELRKKKSYFLNKFKEDGFYLIDSLEEPFEEKYNSAQKVKLIKEKQENLLLRIKKLINKETKVILIATPVFKANYLFLLKNNISVINTESIDFPGSGGQLKFRKKFSQLLIDNI